MMFRRHRFRTLPLPLSTPSMAPQKSPACPHPAPAEKGQRACSGVSRAIMQKMLSLQAFSGQKRSLNKSHDKAEQVMLRSTLTPSQKEHTII